MRIICGILLIASCFLCINGINVDCEFKNSGYWKVLADPYACFITSLNVQKKEEVTHIEGSHQSGFENKDVKAINIYGRVCNVNPSGFDKFFSNIEGFSIWNSTLKTVSSSDLKQFPKLREIWLYVNELRYLPSDLFEYNPNVEYIDFHHNKIKFIGSNFFKQLSKLSKAAFSSNDCIDADATTANELEALRKDAIKQCSTGATENVSTLTFTHENFILIQERIEVLQIIILSLRQKVILLEGVTVSCD